MKGYIYIAGRSADPALHDDLNDPIFGDTPTLGACMPNIRKSVEKGDYIFVVSGKCTSVQQYVVGGFEVEEKISALAAYERFPANRLVQAKNGNLVGNIVVTADGSRHPLDEHHSDDERAFEKRVQNYIIGKNPVVLDTPNEVERSRNESVSKLAEIIESPPSNRIIDLLGRWRKLDEVQVNEIVNWLTGIKTSSI